MKKNTIHAKGYIDDDGKIAVPGVFLEDGAKVELEITVIPGKFEIAMYPSEEGKTHSSICYDCGISEEEINNCCNAYDDCDECPLKNNCMEDDDYE